jgi:hypothetical protein
VNAEPNITARAIADRLDRLGVAVPPDVRRDLDLLAAVPAATDPGPSPWERLEAGDLTAAELPDAMRAYAAALVVTAPSPRGTPLALARDGVVPPLGRRALAGLLALADEVTAEVRPRFAAGAEAVAEAAEVLTADDLDHLDLVFRHQPKAIAIVERAEAGAADLDAIVAVVTLLRPRWADGPAALVVGLDAEAGPDTLAEVADALDRWSGLRRWLTVATTRGATIGLHDEVEARAVVERAVELHEAEVAAAPEPAAL